MKRRSLDVLTALTFILTMIMPVSIASARVVRVEIDSRRDVLDGRDFGDVGPYEMIEGRIFFAFDPDNEFNSRVVDLDLALRNDEGFVEAWANFVALKPTSQAREDAVAFVEVSNRGGKASMSYFNRGRGGLNPDNEAGFGDGLLMRQGLTVIWIGWQFDVPEDAPGRAERMRLHVPTAHGAEAPIEGLVRSDWTLEQTATTLDVAHRNHLAYPVMDPAHADNVLTVRDGRNEPRRIVGRTEWRFARETPNGVVDDSTHIYMEDGFEAGKIYELVYRARDPKVVGLGLAAIRDVMSYAKYDGESVFPAAHGVAFGVSQTGRFLRHYLYQGFNTDEQSRKVYDGLLIHTAGAGRGSFNHRFAQPSRDAHRYSAFFYPTDIFPFTSRPQTDSITGSDDGLAAHAFDDAHLPNVFYTNTGYEYWGRAASLIHTSIDGSSDVEPLPTERIYHLASGQHFGWRFPPRENDRIGAADAFRGNPLDFLTTMRALMVDLVEWVRDDVEPPASRYPRIADDTLVAINDVRFPSIPGVAFPSVIHQAYRADYGSRWSEGIVDIQPPHLGSAFPSLASQVDVVGNEVGGVATVEVMVPLATYAPWNLRTGLANPHELTDFFGSYIPLPLSDAQREENNDPRSSVEGMYDSKAEYLQMVTLAAKELVTKRLLLREDASRAVDRAERHWDWLHERGEAD